VETANRVFKEQGTKVDYLYGTMIEVPRAAITADEVNAAAKKYFPAAHFSVVAVGEEKVIREALAPFGLPMVPAP